MTELTITITLSEEQIAKAVTDLWSQQWQAPVYRGDRGAPAYELLRKQLEAFCLKQDYTELIQQYAAKQIDGIARDVVREELRKLLKKVASEVVKEEAEKGTKSYETRKA